ncbi:hypothetical protein B5864_13580 [Salmonella enterica]|uniref:Uncharacterized protein n=2 Tax=Salmonella enterica TaxID=28901 RepID=A0A403T226_SALER|nr:hypothetical protein [Salmonella sp. SG203]EAB7739622.1 hypothetical protein [Salmonella enterica subsp. enterica serovar Hadar]EAV6575343.1 hypothetical protein [Salmonella enterica]EBQ9003686.1 hypothetical protein [Salmonella enterica subsp. enterica serovar Blockley]EBR8259016.1 hypothetical protein [Salmonella enterica subsp. enterica serovar Cerro]EBW7251932.1 hypothetical protein [Salmonella enterica subsp. enterica serovar Gatow]EBX7469030.1 hypothetical protein [Salmonella enteric
MMKTPFLISVVSGTRRAGRWLRHGSAVSFRVILWGVLLSMLVMLLVAIVLRDPQGDAVRQWLFHARWSLLAWRMVLYGILAGFWGWPGELRRWYLKQLRASGHPNPQFALFRTEIIPVLLIALSEYNTWTQVP